MLQDACVEQDEPVVQIMSTGSGHIEWECSSETQQGESSKMMTEMADVDTERSVIMQSFLDMLLSDTDGMDALQDAQSMEFVACDTPMRDRHVERCCSSESRHEVVQESMHGELEHGSSSKTQQGLSQSVKTKVERVCSLVTQASMTDMEFFDMLMRDEHEVTAVQDMSAIADIERACSSETQQWESDCSGAELLVLQSFSDMLLLKTDACTGYARDIGDLGETQHGDCFGQDDSLDTEVRLAGFARIASEFGALMYEMLISRPDIAAAVGAFAAGLIGRSETDHGIQHRGVQVLDRYLQVCMSSCRQFAELGASSARLPQHIGLLSRAACTSSSRVSGYRMRESLTFY